MAQSGVAVTRDERSRHGRRAIDPITDAEVPRSNSRVRVERASGERAPAARTDRIRREARTRADRMSSYDPYADLWPERGTSHRGFAEPRAQRASTYGRYDDAYADSRPERAITLDSYAQAQDEPITSDDSHAESWEERMAAYDAPAERRTVTIRGQVADRYVPRRPASSRRRPERRYERTGFRPDRTAMWAVLLSVALVLAAVASAHGAMLH
jgi:hypothetical protein